MSIGIVLCSRKESERIPGKPFVELNNEPILIHLIKQMLPVRVPIILAVPSSQKKEYIDKIVSKVDSELLFILGSKHGDDPLARTLEAANLYGLDTIIRITHDKIFIDTKSMQKALVQFNAFGSDYLYSSDLIPGTGFEIFSIDALKNASDKFKKVEFLSYALRLVSKRSLNFKSNRSMLSHNLLIDFPEDLKLHELILARLGSGANLENVISYLSENSDLAYINKPPLVTVYTCAYNASKYLDEAMYSVASQTAFKTSMEYLLIDDGSNDNTCELMGKFAVRAKNTYWFRNPSNVGLASSSSIALKKARGKYIIRLDADDFFSSKESIMEMVNQMEEKGFEALYPDNYFGDYKTIQSGDSNHHVGGALFNKKAVNFIKFTEGLKGYEGLDFFVRAQDKLNIGYYRKPIFFYRQHDDSLTKNNHEERESIRQSIIEGSLNL